MKTTLWQTLYNGQHHYISDQEPVDYTYGSWSYRKLPAEEWRRGEQFLRDRIDVTLPYNFPVHPDHFAYPDPKNLLMLSYRDDRGRRVSTKPGRYLKKFFPDLDHQRLATKWAAEFAPVEVQFAKTPDEIEEVYLEGPSSCMAHSAGHYYGPCHPVRAYGAGDLAIAYIVRDDNITGRALVWPEKKVYSRLYGDEIRLKHALELLGYHEDEDETGFLGARLLSIDAGRYGLVIPYMDNYDRFNDDGTYLTVASNGRIYSQNENGVSDPDGEDEPEYDYTCDLYHEGCDNVEQVVVYFNGTTKTTQYWCDHAVDHHSIYCEYLGENFRSSDGVRMADGEIWSPCRFKAQGTTDADGRNIPTEIEEIAA